MQEPELEGLTGSSNKQVWIGNVLYTDEGAGLHKIDSHPEELDPIQLDDDESASSRRSGWRGLLGLGRRFRRG
jgi:hypothetical protein